MTKQNYISRLYSFLSYSHLFNIFRSSAISLFALSTNFLETLLQITPKKAANQQTKLVIWESLGLHLLDSPNPLDLQDEFVL